MQNLKYILYITILLFIVACQNEDSNETEVATSEILAPSSIHYKIINTYPHDTSSFTQGLEWIGDTLIESTGNYGESKLILFNKELKKIAAPIVLDNKLFGEGTTLFNDKIYQLTWRENKVLIYDVKTFKKINELYWPYEGWGITHNDSNLIISTGGSNLYYVDPTNLAIKKTLGVYNNYGYQSNINELEWVNNKIFANVWEQDYLLVIDPNTGLIESTIDLKNIIIQAGASYEPKLLNPGFVLNGIAFKEKTNTFFITGKCWPLVIELKLDKNK